MFRRAASMIWKEGKQMMVVDDFFIFTGKLSLLTLGGFCIITSPMGQYVQRKRRNQTLLEQIINDQAIINKKLDEQALKHYAPAPASISTSA